MKAMNLHTWKTLPSRGQETLRSTQSLWILAQQHMNFKPFYKTPGTFSDGVRE